MAVKMLERSTMPEYNAHGGWFMGDNEKFEQVGRLAEEVSRLKGELNHVNEKLSRAFAAYQRMVQGQSPMNWNVQRGEIIVPAPYQQQPPADFAALLNKHELVEILEHKQKLAGELSAATERLKGLAPHLF
jgi:hypothetical protein